ncbi:diglucosylglycerate octanoyltransferase [Nocardia sp. NPDC050710]|uniref:diglucosylglycerate octanoyltransferase n=1 Tax=Nocardia sp. NPDC050710 TaxID=3157220 RepID=UPI003403E300
MSSEEPIRSVPDELFQQVTAKPERQLPDALFGPAPAPRTEEPVRSVPDEMFKQVTAKPERHLPDALFGGPPAPMRPAEPEEPEADPPDAAARVAEKSDGAASSETVTEWTESAVATTADSADLAAVEVEAESDDVADTDPVVGTSVSGSETATADPERAAADPVESDAETMGEVGGETDIVPADSAVVAESAEAVTAATVVAESASAVDAEATPAEYEKTAMAAEDTKRPVLLVVADSLSYFGPKGGLPADDPRIWPNLVAAELDWDVELVGRIGWTCRDAYWALIGDPRVWAAVPNAGAVVFAVGGMDTLPSPLPTALRELIRYVRPPRVRRVVRATYNWLQPKLSKLGRPVALPPKVSVDYLEQSREALAQLRPDLPFVGVLPSVHDCAAYGRVHRGRPRAVKALQAWSARTSVPLVDLGEAVRDNIFSGDANPDGIHWGWAGHTAVANAMVKTLQEVR